ncbi:MAG: aminotransferase class I/II-fold pyridoxal phosphate-dependent enzyme [Bryobacterales bacterium]|jgi:threonine aldolase|nr:aminotransferase class I/II-fold pyridoxal phosphate-dependent enzyme [Bryobacterales bacterium]
MLLTTPSPIDLRSDTVTLPTAAMRQAMANAEVGDDVYGEDPTVRKLEWRAAEIFGKQAALFVPSGVMGNTIGIKLHTQHGEEFVCEAHAHVLDWELSMSAWFSGVFARPVAATDGVLRWSDVAPAVRTASPHNARTSLICVENTHNMAGGIVTPVAVAEELYAEAHARGLKVHLDGARIFHAATYLGVSVATLARHADTVMFCLSKGLGSPVGSLLVGTAEDISRAHSYRKRLGGGMRQAGVLAATGLISLEEMPRRLQEDHHHAQAFAAAIADIPGLAITHEVQTNIVIFDVTGTGQQPEAISARLRAMGVLLNGIDNARMRAVTHYDVSLDQCRRAADCLRHVLQPGASPLEPLLGSTRLG